MASPHETLGCSKHSDELTAREPFAGNQLFAFLAARAVPGVEHWDGTSFHRALRLPGGHGVAVITPAPPGRGVVQLRLSSEDRRDVDVAVARIRRLLDLAADPLAVDGALAADSALAPSVLGTPGLRVAGSVDPFETAVRATIGQQISVAAARTVAGRIVVAAGEPLAVDGGALTHVFPSAEALAALDPAALPMPWSRRRTVIELARRVASGDLVLDADADREAVAAGLLDVAGVGPWTAGYVLMRGYGDPDVFLPTDLGARAGLVALGLDASHADRWRPYRSYALHHLWTIAGTGRPGQGG
jgi:AraC family transcriptional regulator of adaptative response / DNA-3-methyladenine glycosylase II